MVEITVKNINFGEKKIELTRGTVDELTQRFSTNDDAVIFVKEDGNICTKDTVLEEGSTVNMIEVFSGG
ncbi:MAG: hypothetical protein M1433_01525 [Candidatus Parvarchaeota archaeon]|nr:hypothetical protein [Candidatus Parvarchaeota archaeon]